MKTSAKVVVIGGGIAGCSTLYHLTEEGVTDVVLVERDELTSGSTWHAAAQVTQFASNQTMAALKRHSIQLYRNLSADPEFPINYHITGGMRLAHTADQVDCYRHFVEMAGGMGVEMEFIPPAEAGRRHPLLSTEGLLGAWWDPLDGDIDPAQLCFALARKARQAGAEIQRSNPVEAITCKPDRTFVVHTRNGNIDCEMLVNASGYRVNEVGSMLGVVHPIVSMEHMYVLTEPIGQIAELDFRVPIIRDPGADFYCRQEKTGLLVGVYEQGCRTFGMDGIDPHFTRSLCPSDIERCLDNMEQIFVRLPCVAEAGIHTVVNGPITYSMDGAPLVGPIPGIPNAFACLGLRAGIGEGGGLGKILAEIMVHGESEWDAWYLDPRRFAGYANTELTGLKAVEDYQREFHYHLPHEHRPAGRIARTTPLYPVLDRMGCQWGVVAGWERSLFFKPYPDFVDVPGYRFTATREVVEREVANLVDGVGIMEVSGFNRYEVSGYGAGDFLDTMICGAMPATDGKVSLCYLLTEKGNVLSEATIARFEQDRYWFCSAAAAEWHDRDWLNRYRPDTVAVREMADGHTLLVVAGPRSRELLQSVSPRSDWSQEAFPWMHLRRVHIGYAGVIAMRVSFSGELAYELHVPNAQLYLTWMTLFRAGEELDLKPFGLYASESMRMEKGYLGWKSDLIHEHNPMETGLERFVRLEKPCFVGKQGLLRQLERGPLRNRVSLAVDCDLACAHSGSPVYSGSGQIGSVTSSGYGYRTRINYAYAFIAPEYSSPGQELEIGIIGKRYPARIIEPLQYDPGNLRVKS